MSRDELPSSFLAVNILQHQLQDFKGGHVFIVSPCLQNIVDLDVTSSLDILLNMSGQHFKVNAAKWAAINQHPQK